MLLLLKSVELTSPLIELLVWALWGMGLLFQIIETLMSWFWVHAQTLHQWCFAAFTLKTVSDFTFQFKNVRFPNLNWPSGQKQALDFFLGIYAPLCHRRDIKPFHNRMADFMQVWRLHLIWALVKQALGQKFILLQPEHLIHLLILAALWGQSQCPQH